MSGTVRRSFCATLCLLAAVASINFASPVRAASINYGDFVAGSGVSFLQVTESSGTDATPLYGPPTPFVVGLDFDPTPAFNATSSDGGADVTDGQLNYTVMGTGVGIASIGLSEGGVYSLLGFGSGMTQVFAGASLQVTVTEIDGLAVAPISLGSANASVAYNLTANPGANQPWSIGLSVNVSAALTSRGISYMLGATKAQVVVDNALAAISQGSDDSGTFASISKRDFDITIIPFPEPSSAVLATLALCGLGFRRRRG